MTNKRFVSTIVTIFLLFAGIFVSAGCDDKDSSSSAPTSNGTFTVTFDSNGGTNVPSQIVESGGTVTMPDNPTREGYVFAWWFKDREFTQNFAFGENGDKVTADITLYARWVTLDEIQADYAVSEIIIGYAEGDNPKYVTQNLTLPTKINSADISWSSSSVAVATDGTVTRQAEDTDVTLTATASYNGKSADPRTFAVKVIRRRTRDNSSIKALSIEEASSGDIGITRNESGDVTDIEGQYVSFNIQNADDALDAVTVLRDELGIKSPDKELKTFLATSNSYGAEYSFHQIYNGVKVYGRSLMASVNASGRGDFLHSSILASNILDSADMKINLTASQAESIVASAYSGDVEIDTERTERIVYSLEDYADKPVYAYIVRVYGTSGGEYADDDVFVNAETGGIITRLSNVCNALEKYTASGDNEFGDPVSFDVVHFPLLVLSPYIMSDPELHVSIHDIVYPKLARSRNNEWNDKHQVSVYSNMREIMRWWKASFDRDSLDGKGTTVDVVTHASLIAKDNASWNNCTHRIYTHNMPENSSFDHFMGAAVDVLAHETTHGVMQYITGGLPNENATGVMNEAYADIFACLKDENWKLGETLFDEGNRYECARDIQSPESKYTLTRIPNMSNIAPQMLYNTADVDIHKYSYIISHTAYLMHQDNNPSNGLTWNELGKVWYESLHMGLDATSKFEDVRRCVIWAAMKIDLSAEKLAVIKAAFDEVNITEAKIKGNVSGIVRDKTSPDKVLEGVRVTAFEKTLSDDIITPAMAGRAFTSSRGKYSIHLEAGKYTLSFDKTGYISESIDVAIVSSEDVSADKTLTPSEISLSGTIRNASDNSYIAGAAVRVRRTGSDKNLKSTTTDVNGLYYFDLTGQEIGTYTVTASKEKYKSNSVEIVIHLGDVIQDLTLEPESEDIPVSDDIPASDDVPVVVGDIPIDEAHFPDENFRLYIFTEIDKNHDRILSRTEIENATEINVYSYGSFSGSAIKFASLQGIKYFVNLQTLNCNGSNLTNLDLSGCTALQNLYCSNTKLISIDVSGCIALESMTCRENELAFLNVSGCSALQYLYCNKNSLTSLDVSGCSTLQGLYCNDNQINSLKLKECTALQTLWCHNNNLTHLDMSDCAALQELSCDNNQLIALDISGCAALKNLYCNNNQLTALNASGLTALQILHCNNNQLADLNVSGCTDLSILLCRNNQLATLDVSDCRQNISISCDSGVQITRPSSSTSAQSSLTLKAQESSSSDSLSVLVVLPSFTPTESGTYTFTVSLDSQPPEGSSLVLLSASDDLNGSFVLTESPDVVRVSADFTAGRLYAPVIAAIHKDESQSGGCDVGNWSIMIFLAGICLMKK